MCSSFAFFFVLFWLTVPVVFSAQYGKEAADMNDWAFFLLLILA